MPQGWKLVSFYEVLGSPGTYSVSIPHYTGNRDRIGDEYDKVLRGELTLDQIREGLAPYLTLVENPPDGVVR